MQVAHTFTVTGTGFFMNVPCRDSATVVFRVVTLGPWQCGAAYGTGAGGWRGQ